MTCNNLKNLKKTKELKSAGELVLWVNIQFDTVIIASVHGLRTPNEAFFHRNFWANNFWGIWGIFGKFISTNFDAVSLLSMFSINQLLFIQKLNFYIRRNPNYLITIGIWIWASKSQGFSHRVSVLRAYIHCNGWYRLSHSEMNDSKWLWGVEELRIFLNYSG